MGGSGIELRLSNGTVVSEMETRHEMEAYGRLRYEIYVCERRENHPERLDPSSLSEEQRIGKYVMDEFDGLQQTTHFVAMNDGRCVGHVRLLDGWCPLARDAGSFVLSETGAGRRIREVSKLMVAKPYRNRRSGVLAALFRMVYHSSVEKENLYLTCLPAMRRFYEKIGFHDTGELFDHGEFHCKYTVMRLNIDDVIQGYLDRGRFPKASATWVRMITRPLP